MATSTYCRPKFQTYWKTKFEAEFETPFSERLLTILYFNTDVGLIPRGKLAVSPASNFCGWFNWKKPIQGCYWCSVKDTSHQAVCCSSNCLILFHEWCVHKVNKTGKFLICKFPGCEKDKLNMDLECCEDHVSIYSTKFGIISSNKGEESPKWYYIDINAKHPINSIPMEDEMTDLDHVSITDVTMPGADCSLFIFSKRLYEGLIYRTDVGPIPRDSYREEQLSSEFAKSPNWRVAIEGCYWCGKPTRANQYTYVCDKKCYSLLHEWCRRKLYEFCGDSLCMYPSCEKPAVETANCCSESHQQILEASYRSIKKGQDTNLGKGPYWYRKNQPGANKITQSFLRNSQTEQPREQQLPFILDATLTEHLMMFTDIGPIPRELLSDPNIIQLSQQFLQNASNWNTKIVGCYWCCILLNTHCYLSMFCNKQCFYLFNEWCFKKLKERDSTINNSCKYIGCSKPSIDSSQCCRDHGRQYIAEYGEFSHLLRTTRYILGPNWYNTSTTLQSIEFYNRDEPFYEFTNFFVCNSLFIDSTSYPTSEHYFQSQKFVGTPYVQHIASMSQPRESFEFSRSNKGTHWTRPDWSETKERVMYRALREKFSQNPELGYLLVSTCRAQIFEHTSSDSYWGDAGDGTGKNRLGVLLMKLRDELKTECTYFPDTLSHYTYDELCTRFVASQTSPLIPPILSHSDSLTPIINLNLLFIKSSINSNNSFKQMRSSDNGWASDEDNASAGEHASTNSTHGVFLKPATSVNSSKQDSDGSTRPPPFNPDFSLAEGPKVSINQTDNSESMET